MLIVLLATLVADAADAGKKARKASRIIDDYVAAIGGERNVLRLQSLICYGYMEQQGMQMKFTLYRQRPNRTRLEAFIGSRRIVQAFDGHEGWWTNPFNSMTPEPMPDAVWQSVMPWVDFDGPLVRYKRKGHHAEYVDEVDLDSGRRAYHIKLTLADGAVWQVYIDSETHLEVRRTYDVTIDGQRHGITTEFVDYVAVGDVLLPREIKGVGVNGTSYRMIFTEYDTTSEVDPAIFEKPQVDESGTREQ